MPRYNIVVCGTKYMIGEYFIVADSLKEAEEMAMDMFDEEDNNCCDFVEVTEAKLCDY